MMMDLDTMQSMMGSGEGFGGFGAGWFMMWITYVLFIVLLALGIAALIKYLAKK